MFAPVASTPMARDHSWVIQRGEKIMLDLWRNISYITVVEI
jgi:hypothetical protein